MAIRKKGSKSEPGMHPRFGWKAGEMEWRKPTEEEEIARKIAEADPNAIPMDGLMKEAYLRDGTLPKELQQ